MTTVWFINKFEGLCGSKASVQRLRSHPSFTSFIARWSLPVYFQIRFAAYIQGVFLVKCIGWIFRICFLLEGSFTKYGFDRWLLRWFLKELAFSG